MKAYLGWPVKLKNLPADLHVTLKYIGEVKDYTSLVETIRLKLAGSDTRLNLTGCEWHSTRFGSKAVLVLAGVPVSAYDCQSKVKDICKDSFPSWTPHVTLENSRLTHTYAARPVEEAVESVGPLTLFVKADGDEYKAAEIF